MSNVKINNNCSAVGLVVAAIAVGILAYFITTIAPVWVAVISFFVLLAFGLWFVQQICGGTEEQVYHDELVEDRKEYASEEAGDIAAADDEKTAAAPVVSVARPRALEAARDGNGDDLKRIKGVGPAMEKMLNEMGFYHYDQIAAWTESEVTWVDDNLQGFKGRVTRDGWVDQAKTLAEGGETAFSDKVDKGGVY